MMNNNQLTGMPLANSTGNLIGLNELEVKEDG
jgi:hypothetical protein